MKKAFPDNSRWVLTWIRDSGKLEYWQIDMYNGFWIEASAWEQEVLYWQELPERPNHEL